MGQVSDFQAMLSLQVLPEVILSRPVLVFIPARAHVTAIHRLIVFPELVDTSLVSLQIVIGAESLSCLGAARNVTFVWLVVPRLVLPFHLVLAGHLVHSWRETYFISEFVLTG